MTDDSELRAAVASGVVGSSESFQELLGAIVHVARSIFGAKASSILLLDEEAGELVFEAVVGEGEESLLGTRFPAVATSMGQVLLADLPRDELGRILATPSQSGIIPRLAPSRARLERELDEVRARGWALSDERLSLGIRSIAAPVRDAAGTTVAAVNVTVHAAETSVAELKKRHLPLLLATAAAITEELVNLARLPVPDPLTRA